MLQCVYNKNIMSHFRLTKKAQHFRTLKGWRKEIKEMSFGFLLVMLVITGFSAKTVHAQSPGLVFWGRVISMQPCGVAGSPSGPLPCTTLFAPNVLVIMQGPIPMLEMNPFMSKSGLPPRIGGWILGFASPPFALQFYAY